MDDIVHITHYEHKDPTWVGTLCGLLEGWKAIYHPDSPKGKNTIIPCIHGSRLHVKHAYFF